MLPRYFLTLASVEPHNCQPEKIANKSYEGRMGNGNEGSGDGYQLRGRGILQLTGRDHYKACSLYLFGKERLLDDPNWRWPIQRSAGNSNIPLSSLNLRLKLS